METLKDLIENLDIIIRDSNLSFNDHQIKTLKQIQIELTSSLNKLQSNKTKTQFVKELHKSIRPAIETILAILRDNGDNINF